MVSFFRFGTRKNTRGFFKSLLSKHKQTRRRQRVSPSQVSERLEERSLLTLSVAYAGTGNPLTLSETAAGADTVTVSEVAANTLRIDLGAGVFDAGSSQVAGLTYENAGSPQTSNFVDVDITNAAAVTSLNLNLGDDTDSLSIGTVDDSRVSSISIDGGAGNNSLTVVGTAGDDRIVHRPGATSDSGSIQVNTLLGIQYSNLGAAGTLTVDGGGAAVGGADVLAVEGTANGDQIVIAATTGAIQVSGTYGDRVVLTPANIGVLQVDGLGGDDLFNVGSPLPYTAVAVVGESLSITDAAGVDDAVTVTPGVTPVLSPLLPLPPAVGGIGTVTVNAVPIVYLGARSLVLTGTAGDADTLTIFDDGGDNEWNVNAAPGTAVLLNRVQIDDRESIDYANFAVTLDNNAGDDVFRVQPASLIVDTSFSVDGNVGDLLELIGRDAVDTVTATASVVTFDGVPITVVGGLSRVQLTLLGGADTATMTTFATPLTILGGNGSDVLLGGTLVDEIYGGNGDDTLIGGAGNDQVYGEAVNDRFGDTSTAGNGVADDPGADVFNGGDGIDQFIWEPGDGSDVIQGGDDGADILRFFGSDATADTITVTGGAAATHLNTILGAATVDTHGVEQVFVTGRTGGDTITVNDVTESELDQLVIDVTTGDSDAVVINGRDANDNLLISTPTAGSNTVNIVGLAYTVQVNNLLDGAGNDTLTVNGNDGDDVIKAVDGVEAEVNISLTGGAGNDFLSADATLVGNAGSDTLVGGTGNDSLSGGAGEDLFIGGLGNDTIDGGADFDTILISGTSGADVIDVNQTSATTLVHRLNAVTQTDTLVLDGGGARTVEEVRVEADGGADTIRIRVTDSAATNLIDATANSLLITVHGGDATGAGDRLIVVDDGPADHSRDDLTIYRKDQDDSAGRVTVGPGNAEPFENVFTGIERVQFLDGSGASVSADPGSTSRLVVFKQDPFEYNDDRFVATHIGANSVVNVDPTIDPTFIADPFGDGVASPTDFDWYRVVAAVTGTLDIQAHFEEIGAIVSSGRPGLPSNGDLQIEIYDADGFVAGVSSPIAGNGPNFGTNNGASEIDNDGDSFAENERIRIPTVQGQVYYLRVFGATAAAVNNYNLTLINEAPPTPFDLELADNLVFITGDQVAPAPVVTNAGGTANFQYNAAANTFDLDLFVSGVELTNLTSLPELTAAHIHTGAVGSVGAIIVTLPLATDPSWSVETSGIRLRLTGAAFSSVAADITALLAGNTYFDIHTTAFAGGEIRGQIGIPHVLGVSDTGRSQLDNKTRDNTPTIFLRVDDAVLLNDVSGNDAGVVGAPPVDEVISNPHNTTTGSSPVGLAPGYRVAIYDETDSHAPVLLGFAQPVANLRGVYSFTFPTALSEGSHFISSRLQLIDPADNDLVVGTQTRATGFGPRSESFEIVVDTVVPPVFFGVASIDTDGLIPEPGVIPQPTLFIDNRTNNQTPGFWGTAEANTVIRVFADLTPTDNIDNFDVQLGVTVALPADGTNQFTTGQWRVTSTVDLNNPMFFPVDGLRRLLVTAEDVAGNQRGGAGINATQALNIFLDTQGPQVTNVQITSPIAGAPPLTFDLFDPKPSLGPTPRTDGLTISVRDFPIRATGFLNPALNPTVAENPGHYVLRGDANGIIPISSITFTPDTAVIGSAATGRVELTFASPLLDDRYTLTIDDDVVDDLGNKLDGNSNVAQPLETPTFPSGDGQPGGDFVARFTVDSRVEIGGVGQGGISVDINGNFRFDPTNSDFVNRDLVFELGLNTDAQFVGKFNVPGVGAPAQDGFDRIGAYGKLNNQFRWLLDLTNDGRPDFSVVSGLQINGLPIAGNFSTAHDGDEIGLFDGTNWYFDTNGDNNITAADTRLTGNLRGLPIVGDFDGDGLDDLGVHRAQSNVFSFDLTGAADGTPGVLDGNADDTISFNATVPLGQTPLFPGVLERPFAGDFNLDGIDDIGLMVPNRNGVGTNSLGSEFYIFQSIRPAVLASGFGTVNALDHQFSPTPLGVDLYAQFGSNIATPLVGNFDPPVTPTGADDSNLFDPEITSSATVNVVENTTGVTTVTASDIDFPAQTLSFSIVGGTDAAQFSITSSGTLRFNSAPRFASPADANSDNVYEVDVQVTDGERTDTQSLSITVEKIPGTPLVVTLPNVGGPFTVLKVGNNLHVRRANGSEVMTPRDVSGISSVRIIGSKAADVVVLDNSLSDFSESFRFDGGTGADRFDASAVNFAVTFDGGAGNDTFLGGGGDDHFLGAAGNDNATGGSGNDVLNGQAGNDTLAGGAGNDVLTGESGNDSFDGGADSDRIVEIGNANLTITATGLTGLGTDTIILNSVESASLTGGAGNNTLKNNGFLGSVTLAGGAGNDVLTGGTGNDSLDGGAGKDLLIVANVDDVVLTDTSLTGAGLDVLVQIECVKVTVTVNALTSNIDASAFSGSVTLTGGNGADSLKGGSGNDSIVGGLGNDDLHGGAGLDTIDGGAGNDCLRGDAGNDKLLGTAGNDTIRGGADNDSIDGGADDDVLLGEAGNDTIMGGTGDLATDPVGSRGDDIISGGDGNDVLNGQDGNDTILGGTGTDKLTGGKGTDILSGEDGIDTLTGDAGTDTMFGGQEQDVFTKPIVGEMNEDGVFNDVAFFANLEALLAACP